MAGRRRRGKAPNPFTFTVWALVIAIGYLILSHVLLLLVVAGVAVFWLRRGWFVSLFAGRAYTERLRNSDIAAMDLMDGVTFESRLRVLFQDLGYGVEQTKASHDHGADLVLTRDGVRTVVQAKRYDVSQAVGVSAVEEALHSLPYYRAHRAMVVTNQYLSASAQRYAAEHDVEVMNRRDLIRALAEATTRGAGQTDAGNHTSSI